MSKKKPAKVAIEAVAAEENAKKEVNETPVVAPEQVAAVKSNDAPVQKKGKKTPSQTAQKGKKRGNVFKAIAKWFKEIISELKKVTWPKGKDVAKSTTVVVVVVLVFFVVLFAIDYVLAGLLSLLVNGAWPTTFIG